MWGADMKCLNRYRNISHCHLNSSPLDMVTNDLTEELGVMRLLNFCFKNNLIKMTITCPVIEYHAIEIVYFLSNHYSEKGSTKSYRRERRYCKRISG